MRKVRAAYVDLDEGQVHVRVVDGSGPAILFLHQTASSSLFYSPLLERLALPNPLVAVDLPGFGGSFDPSGDPSMAWYAGVIARTADGLGIERFHLLGHHTGASLAMELAATLPDRSLSLMLVGPVFMTGEERTAFLESHGQPIPLDRDGAHLKTNWDYAAGYNPGCPLELIHQEVVAMLRARIGRGQAYRAVAHHDTAAIASAIRAPVLILTSAEDYFHAALDRARAALPSADVIEIGGANFQPALDVAGTAAAIEAFLAAQMPASGAST